MTWFERAAQFLGSANSTRMTIYWLCLFTCCYDRSSAIQEALFLWFSTIINIRNMTVEFQPSTPMQKCVATKLLPKYTRFGFWTLVRQHIHIKQSGSSSLNRCADWKVVKTKHYAACVYRLKKEKKQKKRPLAKYFISSVSIAFIINFILFWIK